MSEPSQRPRFPSVALASEEDLKRGLTHTLTALGYRFNQDIGYEGGKIDFEAFDASGNVVIITVTPDTTDEVTIARAIRHLGGYRQGKSKTDV
jgi:hypothetical protein